MKKSYLVGALLLLWSVAVWGQTPDEGFASQLKSYVEARVAGEDAAFTLVQLNDSYKQSDTAAQSHYRELLKREVAAALRSQAYPQALEMIRLHDLLVTRSEDRVPELYLIEGTIYSRQNDSVRLKETIAKLESLERGTHLLPRLNGYLEQMRNYISADKYLEGYWVSDLRAVHNWRGVAYPIEPFCSFLAKQQADTLALDLLWRPIQMPSSKPEIVFPYSTDSLYICWSSERLRNINPESVTSYRNIVRETSAQMAGTASQRHVYSSSERLANNLMVNLGEMGVNSLISALSTPNKTVLLIEARLKHINDRLYSGTLHYYWCRISAEGKKQETEWNQPVNFHRWDVESGVVFGRYTGDKVAFYYGQTADVSRVLAKQDTGYYKQIRQLCNRTMNMSQYLRIRESFNTAQYRQLEIYNQRLLDPSQTPIIVVPEGMRMCGWLGATVRKVSAEEVAANKWSDDRGLWIESMAEASPAFVAGFREGDVIRTVGGVAVNTPEELAQKIKSYPAGAELTIELMRKDKLLSRIVRLSYQFIPKDE